MNENLANLSNININDFIKIYPPNSNSMNSSLSSSNKFIKLFAFRKMMRKSIDRPIARKSQSNILSLIDLKSIDSIEDKNNIGNNNKNFKLKIISYSESTDYYLLYKALDLQNRNKKRTIEIKNALS